MTWQAGRVAIDRAPRTNYENADGKATFFPKKIARRPSFVREKKRIFDVLDAHLLRLKNDPDYIEPEGVARLLEARDPNFGRSAELALLSPVDRAHRPTEIVRRAGFHFDKSNCSPSVAFVTGGDKIDIPMAVAKSTLRDAPTVHHEPARCDALAPLAHRLACLRHEGKPTAGCGGPSI